MEYMVSTAIDFAPALAQRTELSVSGTDDNFSSTTYIFENFSW